MEEIDRIEIKELRLLVKDLMTVSNLMAEVLTLYEKKDKENLIDSPATRALQKWETTINIKGSHAREPVQK